MAWDHLSITKPHLVYIILGGFTSLFMLCSSIIKERAYIGEATVATLCGVIFGPHAANLIDPESWGNVDITTIEFSRLVLVVQCFAVGVELPKFYMEKHWKSVVFLLVPVMTFGWLITSLVIWWMIPPLNWLESLVVAACVTATDPVLASSVVGKGKFAKRVPKHLRDLLSAESGCNDGMAFPFVYLSLYLIQDNLSAKEVTFHWIVYTILYECIFGAVYGFVIGYLARHGIKYAEKHDMIDRESFLVFYFVLALWCAGSGSILGVDDLLVGFACGVGFSNDGWFTQKTEEAHVSNVIDLLLNLAYFVYFGTIIPWEQYNDAALGMSAWRLVVIAVFVILFRRIPIMMALKPLIPDIKTWREALFAGHFGPIGVGAIFVAILARAELEHEEPVPLGDPPTDTTLPHYTLFTLVWPIVTFLVISSIIVHGSSIAVFTLGKRINTLTLTMSYTTAPEDGPSWMNRLPRISSQSKSQAKTMSDTDGEDLKMPDYPPGTLPPLGYPGNFLRRQKEEDQSNKHGSRASSLSGRRRKKKWDDGVGPGGPVSQSAIFPQRRSQSEMTLQNSQSPPNEKATPSGSRRASDAEDPEKQAAQREDESLQQRVQEDADEELRKETSERNDRRRKARKSGEQPLEEREPEIEVYDEGDHIIVENQDGDVVAVEASDEHRQQHHLEDLKSKLHHEGTGNSRWNYDALKKRIGHWRDEEMQKRKEKQSSDRRHEPARAYQFGNTIIVEDEDGEVVKKYELPPTQRPEGQHNLASQSLKYMGMGGLVKPKAGDKSGEPSASASGQNDKTQPTAGRPAARPRASTWRMGRGPGASEGPDNKKKIVEAEQEDDKHIRFTIGGVGQRMTKADFISEMQKLDARTRREVVDQSNAPERVKTLAKEDPPEPEMTVGTARGKAISPPQTQAQPKAQQPQDQIQAQPAIEPSLMRAESSHSSSTKGKEPVIRRTSPSPLGEDQRLDSGDDLDEEDEDADDAPSHDLPETAVERRRRLAVLEGLQGDGSNSTAVGEDTETPAERRRREAALGMGGGEDDSDDDDTPRVPPARRGIRFADVPDRGRR
ncbi:Na+/H+ antiporter [Gnomoniopsis sp. IMI 355080]|nr:Na+/H+ antiporter [Gnomoniopsis sp. IMI 355080]